ncbi:hypothetical protein PF005_g26101 [Phytophthora fragariae]|uniref:Transposase Tc1-like domain-containing protein n=1 Tax=Phytophthora fragariae TaxID=53985 RepID=A0A6A3XBC6_9STRA|nr:hypothetical protein PF009_g20296 [Phytophthora fragariae]KAE8973997.1 hypothetical protein PF011_g25026 [Phytophthora fragariae]KAE9064830.1 hypothetical protein PF007_g29055 [Phytophthora fragariae]KAE9073207.1 hypothetical protein PF010_g25165 [Phytophthora fragariae]KAE9089007.1 hypothetical protein PF006_g25454 [Phytophthora fragariae]
MDDRVAAVVKSRKSARGRKKLDRAVLCEHVSAVPVNERENHRKIQQASNTSSYLVQQLIKEGYMRRALRQTRPLLTASHRVARLKFAVNHVKLNGDGQYYFDPMFDVVHIDEKWFYVKKIGQRVYVLTGKDGTPLEEAPVQYVQSKRHIKKVMFLCAVARPRGDWDGKIGLWPVVETYITQRWSVNRPAGVEEIKPVSMNRTLARRMLVTDVIPAIKAKWPQDQKATLIRIQQDNARPHVLEEDAEVLAAGRADGWNIRLKNQPAQSPDLNCLDLGYLCSIQSLQSHTSPRTTEDLIKEVELTFAETTAETLNKTFLTLQLVMKEIMTNEGRNNYRLPHIHKDKLINAGQLPTTLMCDAEILFSAHSAIAMLSVEQIYAEQLRAAQPRPVSCAGQRPSPPQLIPQHQPSLLPSAFATSDLDPFLL